MSANSSGVAISIFCMVVYAANKENWEKGSLCQNCNIVIFLLNKAISHIIYKRYECTQDSEYMCPGSMGEMAAKEEERGPYSI